ncbi:hypothetical protein M3Y98_00077300 [Aphelenchoides besseyi]|nr:hypothetical protein M3Y98_00077300 [Aphelenchoides besseyi]KAI6198692.1 hypothetical protein M3Y96_00546600 [Aphelenchoides besseyi]
MFRVHDSPDPSWDCYIEMEEIDPCLWNQLTGSTPASTPTEHVKSELQDQIVYSRSNHRGKREKHKLVPSESQSLTSTTTDKKPPIKRMSEIKVKKPQRKVAKKEPKESKPKEPKFKQPKKPKEKEAKPRKVLPCWDNSQLSDTTTGKMVDFDELPNHQNSTNFSSSQDDRQYRRSADWMGRPREETKSFYASLEYDSPMRFYEKPGCNSLVLF